MARHMKNLAQCVLVLVATSMAGFAQDVANPSVDATKGLQAIFAQWEANEARFQSVRCSWDETRLFTPASVIPAGVPGFGGIAEDSRIVQTGWPLSDIILEGPHHLLLSGAMMRNEELMLGLPPDGGEGYQSSRHLSSFDGTTSVTAGIREDSTGNQVKQVGTSNVDARGLMWTPVRYVVRPIDRRFQNRKVDALRVQTIDATSAVLVDAYSVELHVDRSNDGLITRALQRHPKKDELLWDYDLTVSRNDQGICVPKEWTLREWSGEKLSRVQTAVVTEFSFGEPLAASDFQLDLPPNLEVFDQRMGLTRQDSLVRQPTPVKSESRTFDYFWLIVILGVVFTAAVWQKYLRRKPI